MKALLALALAVGVIFLVARGIGTLTGGHHHAVPRSGSFTLRLDGNPYECTMKSKTMECASMQP